MKHSSEQAGLRLASKGPERTQALGRVLGTLLRAGDWIGLSGDLGAGKTCFVQGVAAGVGVPESSAVTSPTFTIVQSYPGTPPLLHMDLYRMGGYDELAEIGYEEMLEGDEACLVEWWDKFPGTQPAAGLLIEIELEDLHSRILSVRAFGDRGAELLAAWRAVGGEDSGHD